MAFGKTVAKMASDYHERDNILMKSNERNFSKDNVIDLVNNEYVREYGNKFDFNTVTKDLNSFTEYLNGVVQHVLSTVDGYSKDERFKDLASGQKKLFKSNDKQVKEIYKSAKQLQSVNAK